MRGATRRRWTGRRGKRQASHDKLPPPALGPVLIIGTTSRTGRQLVRWLHRVRPVLSLDPEGFSDRPKDVEHFEFDLSRSKARDLFRLRTIDAVVYLGLGGTGWHKEDPATELGSFQRLLDYVQQSGVKKLVLLSSAAVYGARPGNPQFLSEDAPLLGGHVGGLGSLDLLAQSFFWKHPRIETVILRPVHVLGPLDNGPSNYLRLGVVPTLLGFDPMIQVLHLDDLIQALERTLVPGVRGIFNVAGPPPCTLSHAIERLGRRRVPLPQRMLQALVGSYRRRGREPGGLWELDFLRYVCMVDDTRLRKLTGYQPRHDLAHTLRSVDEERWI